MIVTGPLEAPYEIAEAARFNGAFFLRMGRLCRCRGEGDHTAGQSEDGDGKSDAASIEGFHNVLL